MGWKTYSIGASYLMFARFAVSVNIEYHLSLHCGRQLHSASSNVLFSASASIGVCKLDRIPRGWGFKLNNQTM